MADSRKPAVSYSLRLKAAHEKLLGAVAAEAPAFADSGIAPTVEGLLNVCAPYEHNRDEKQCRRHIRKFCEERPRGDPSHQNDRHHALGCTTKCVGTEVARLCADAGVECPFTIANYNGRLLVLPAGACVPRPEAPPAGSARAERRADSARGFGGRGGGRRARRTTRGPSTGPAGNTALPISAQALQSARNAIARIKEDADTGAGQPASAAPTFLDVAKKHMAAPAKNAPAEAAAAEAAPAEVAPPAAEAAPAEATPAKRTCWADM